MRILTLFLAIAMISSISCAQESPRKNAKGTIGGAAIDAVGDLVKGRRGTLSLSLTSADTAGGVATVTAQLDGGGVVADTQGDKVHRSDSVSSKPAPVRDPRQTASR